MENEATRLNAIARDVVDCAVRIHKVLGPGLLERAYRQFLATSLESRGHVVATEVRFPVEFEGESVSLGYRVDILVDDEVIVELKAVPELAPAHEAQVLTYLRLSGRHLGLLINFHAFPLRDGIRRYVMDFPDD